MDIQIGDKVTIDCMGDVKTIIITTEQEIKQIKENVAIFTNKILKIERPKYEVVEEKKELLTEEEREFLKLYIKIIKSLNNGQIISIRKQSSWIILGLKTGLEYQADIGSKFKNMEDCKKYNFSELGLEEN